MEALQRDAGDFKLRLRVLLQFAHGGAELLLQHFGFLVDAHDVRVVRRVVCEKRHTLNLQIVQALLHTGILGVLRHQHVQKGFRLFRRALRLVLRDFILRLLDVRAQVRQRLLRDFHILLQHLHVGFAAVVLDFVLGLGQSLARILQLVGKEGGGLVVGIQFFRQ